jgi:hypothetical protein
MILYYGFICPLRFGFAPSKRRFSRYPVEFRFVVTFLHELVVSTFPFLATFYFTYCSLWEMVKFSFTQIITRWYKDNLWRGCSRILGIGLFLKFKFYLYRENYLSVTTPKKSSRHKLIIMKIFYLISTLFVLFLIGCL